MKKLWIIISVCWLWTCGGGGGSPTEPKEPAPVSNFTATPTTLIQGQSVTFTSTSTGTITSYAWNVDDDPAIEATTATYEHTYTEVGTYSITLTVTGPGGSNPKTVADMITVSTAAPTPTTETSQTVQEDGSTTISLTATDPNGQAVTFAITTDPTNGTATLSGTEINYTPNANFYGTDSFDYTASNGTYTSDPVTITITIEGQDDEPTTNDVSATTDEDTVVTVNLDATEIDGDNYSFSIISQPTNGTLGSINGNQVEYTPNQDWNGTDNFTFEATDDRTSRRNVATATITVNAVNDAPVANDITSQVTDENRAMQLDITLDATDVEGDALTYGIVDTNNGTVTVNGSTATYIPNQDWNGEDTFTYKANDGTDDSNTATVTVTVNSVNDAPVTQNVSFTMDEDTPYTESYTGYVSDVDGDDLTIIGVTNPTFGTATCEGTDCTYTPYQDVHGTDTFTYKVNDGELDSNVSTVSVTINPVNDAPVANDVTASTTSRMGNMRQSVDITLSVTDADGDDLTISIVSDVSNGSTSLSGSTVTYTPTANYDGTDTFTYKANDGTVDSNIATATITVQNINEKPSFYEDSNISVITAPYNIQHHIVFFGQDDILQPHQLNYTIETSMSGTGGFVSGKKNELRYNPTVIGTDNFQIKVSDGINDSELRDVTINVVNSVYKVNSGIGGSGRNESIRYGDLTATTRINNRAVYLVNSNGEIVNTIDNIISNPNDVGGQTNLQNGGFRLSNTGNLMIAGRASNFSELSGDASAFINIYDSNLDISTELVFGGYYSVMAFLQKNNGNFALIADDLNGSVYLIETNSSGAIINQNQISFPTNAQQNSNARVHLYETDDNGYIVAVNYYNNIYKFDSNLNLTFTFFANGIGKDFLQLDDGSFIHLSNDEGGGYSTDHQTPTINYHYWNGGNTYIQKFDSSGLSSGSFTVDGYGAQIGETNDNIILISHRNFEYTKVDLSGNVISNNDFGNYILNSTAEGVMSFNQAMTKTPDGNFLIFKDPIILKVTSSGELFSLD